jgi:serine/threonine protein kinase
MHGTNLFEFLKVERAFLTPDEYLQIFKDIMTGLKYLHDCNILHRDIKPENILIARNIDGKIYTKICDFGLAFSIEEEGTDLQQHVVSRFYRAPEVILGIPYSKGVDIFAAATVFAEMINILAIFQAGRPCGNLSPISKGIPALELNDSRGIYMVQQEVLARMTDGTHPIIKEIQRIFPRTSDRLISFLLDMLNPDPNRRISAETAVLECESIRLQESSIERSKSVYDSF